ncbi:MAG: hypothetical protein Q9167_001479 [Letrouitia subvulpina]
MVTLGSQYTTIKSTNGIFHESQMTLFPEILPPTSGLSHLGWESENVLDNTFAYDPTTKDRIAFGRALHPANSCREPETVPVVATVCGTAGELVKIVRTEKEHLEWPNKKKFNISVEVLQVNEQGLWTGNGSPIQQLCFAYVDGAPSEWLAVRYHGATSILRPVLRDSVGSTSHSVHLRALTSGYPICRIDPNHIATLPVSHTGGAPHVDVCFNPWNPHEFAITDHNGRWSIWKIECLNKLKGAWRLHPGPSGLLKESAIEKTPDSGNDETGWGAILWAEKPTSLVVARRRMFALQDLAHHPSQLTTPDLSLKGTSDWILDVRRGVSDKNYIFVVTSSRLFWLYVASTTDDLSGAPRSAIKVLLSWTHFRNATDLSLRISILEEEKRTLALLYSQLTGLHTVFTFELENSSLEFPTSVCDPYILLAGLHSTQSIVNVSTLILQRAAYNVFETSKLFEHGQAYNDNFYQAFYLCKDLSLHEQFYVQFPPELDDQVSFPKAQSRSRSPKSACKIQDDFIVPNGTLQEVVESAEFEQALSGIQGAKDDEGLTTDEVDPWTLNFEWLAELLCSSPDDSSLARKLLTPCISMTQALDLIESEISDTSLPLTHGIVSLIELIESDIYVEDIEAASSHLERILQEFSKGHSLITFNVVDDSSPILSSLIPKSIAVGLPRAPEATLLQYYNHLLNSWISPLSSSIPVAVRLKMEKVIRNSSAQLYLASLALMPQQPSIQSRHDEEVTGDFQRPATFTLPVRERRRSGSHGAKGKQKEQEMPSLSSPVPNSLPEASSPKRERTPSLRSQPSDSSLDGTAEDPASVRLRGFAPIAPQPVLPPSLQRVVSHWDVGADPETYDWEATEEALDRAANEEAKLEEPEPGSEEGRRKKRKLEKRLKRQREGTVVGASASASQPAPQRVKVSEPEGEAPVLGSSQVADVASTQPEKGRFWDVRKTTGKKKKKPGFR